MQKLTSVCCLYSGWCTARLYIPVGYCMSTPASIVKKNCSILAFAQVILSQHGKIMHNGRKIFYTGTALQVMTAWQVKGINPDRYIEADTNLNHNSSPRGKNCNTMNINCQTINIHPTIMNINCKTITVHCTIKNINYTTMNMCTKWHNEYTAKQWI